MIRSELVSVRALVVAIVPLCAAHASAQATFEPVARVGQSTPGGSTFSDFYSFTLNEQGQIGFRASYASFTQAGHFRGNAAARVAIAREDQAAPDGNGALDQPSFDATLNDAGAMAFRSDLHSTSGGANDDQAIYRGSGGTLTQVAREGQAAPDANGQFASFGASAFVNAVGHVAFSASLRNTLASGADNSGIFVGDGGSTSTIVREGNNLPAGTGKFGSFSLGGFNDAGQAPFHATLTGVPVTEGDRGIFRGTTTGVTQIARRGDLAPDANGRFEFVSSFTPLSNASGQVLFTTDLAGTANGAADNYGIFIGSGGAVTQVARERQDAPDGNGRIAILNDADFIDSGHAVFRATLGNTAGGTTDDVAIYRGNGGALTTIAREGQQAPNGNGSFSGFIHFDANGLGQVALVGVLAGTTGGATDGTALFLYDDAAGGLVELLRRGSPLFGSTVTDVSIAGGTDATILNDRAQIAFRYNLANGQSGIALATVPEPTSLATFVMPVLATVLARRRRR